MSSDSEPNKINVVTCTNWVPQGVAIQNPEKVEITKEELEKIIKETSENLADLEEVQEDEYTELEVEALEEDMKVVSLKPARKAPLRNDAKSEDVKMEEEEYTGCEEDRVNGKEDHTEEDDEEDIEKRYDFEHYDTEKDGSDPLLKLGKLTVHADNEDDPHVTFKEEDSESEIENKQILPTDNLITVGHVDGDAAILEVYVYNSEEASLYVHHDILLPAVPLCMEWLNFDPEDENLKPGNMIAIGSMSPIVEIWDLNLIDCLEPAYTLGRKPKKKKMISREGHSDAVLCLGWNRELEHILASGSVDKSIILWDLQACKESQKVKLEGKVQDLKWHPKENHYLIAGSCDKRVRLLDFSSEESGRKWKLDGEIESLVWDPFNSFQFFASTDTGAVYQIDGRHTKPLQRIQAHEMACSGMVTNSACRGCLVTVSEDESVKIWDVAGGEAKLVEERLPNLGVIHTVSQSPNSPFVLSLGGNNRVNNFKVWDMRQSRKVRANFFDRLSLPIDDGEREEEEEEEEGEEGGKVALTDEVDVDKYAMEEAFGSSKGAAKAGRDPSQWKPKPKSKKKKGGHLDARRNR